MVLLSKPYFGGVRALFLLSLLACRADPTEAVTSSFWLDIPPGNLTTNPSFETDSSGWFGYRSSLVREAHPQAPDGSYVAKVTCDTPDTYSVDDSPSTAQFASASIRYRASAWVAAAEPGTVGTSILVAIRENSGGSNVQVRESPTVQLTNTFQRIWTELTPSTTGNELEVYVWSSDGVPGRSFYVDAIMMFPEDSTPPVAGAVMDGAGMDINAQPVISSLSANWSLFTDLESGIVTYEWALGTSPGGNDIQPFTAVGAATSATRSGLSLSDGTRVYVTVRGRNAWDLTAEGSSDGVVVDASPPPAGDIDIQSLSTTSVQANWSGFDDPHSGIKQYRWAIGTSPGLDDIQAWTNTGTVTSGTSAPLSLQAGATYYVNVEATNNAGLTTSVHRAGTLSAALSEPPASPSPGADPDMDRYSVTIACSSIGSDTLLTWMSILTFAGLLKEIYRRLRL